MTARLGLNNRRIPTSLLAALTAMLCLGAAASLRAADKPAQVPPGESGRNIDHMIQHSATGLIAPGAPVPADVELAGNGVSAWMEGQSHRMLLTGDVRIAIGSYGFKAEKAFVVITPRSIPGLDARDVSVYLEHVTELGGYGPIQQEAGRLLVTATVVGKVKLETALLKREAMNGDNLVAAGLARIERYRNAVAANTKPIEPGDPLISDQTFDHRKERRTELRDVKPETLPPPLVIKPKPTTPTPAPGEAIVPAASSAEAQVDFHAGKVVYKKGPDEAYVILMDNIEVMYVDPKTNRRLNLTADKAVLFVSQQTADNQATSAPASQIRGVYLEDNVIATDGQYTLRGPRIYYDIADNRAVVLDAVFYTWDVQRQVPLYVRAEKLKQHSGEKWSADNAKLTTSEFFEPHFAIGAKSLTVTADEAPGGEREYKYTAEGMTADVGSHSVFLWPKMTGNATDTALKSINVGASNRRGAIFETKWDLFNLIDQPKPNGVDAELLVDGYTKRGPAIGLDMNYDVPNAYGSLESYYIHDDGEDRPSGRNDIDPQAENRGRINWRHRHQLPDNWEATAELSYLSDPTFLEEFFTQDALASKEYESLIYLKQQREDWAFTFLTKYDLQDFVAQSDLLQTRGNVAAGTGIGATPGGYTTDKLPEIAYYRIGTSLWDDRLSWYSENRASVMRLNLPKDQPGQRGFTPAQSVALFGIASNTTPFDVAYAGLGLDEQTRYRIDSRQELDAPLHIGDVNITPYVVGRVTGYDDDFATYGGSDDAVRLWGGGGLRASTAFCKTYGDVDSALFDLHKIRHIIEPSVNLLYAQTTINQEELPVYDYGVESLAEGGIVQFGLRNTLQTQRGGPSNWRTVDWLRIETDFVMATGETQRESHIARFFDYRPEMSLYDNFLYNEVAWQVTDTFAAMTEVNYNLDRNEIEQWNIGFQLDHDPRLSSFTTLRLIDEVDSFILSYGFEYMLTPKYQIAFSQAFDIHRSQTRNITLTVTRRLPRWLLMVAFDFDTVGDVSSIGIALAPEGIHGPGSVTRNPFLMR